MSLFSRLFGTSAQILPPLRWDMHNHILPGIDDGSASAEQSLRMAELYLELGYERLIATPHIMSDAYPNTPGLIRSQTDLLKKHLNAAGFNLGLDCAAEYYMDEVFAENIRDGKELLTFADKHILVETSFLNKPMFFANVMFGLQAAGYKPVLAHPERYLYFQDNYADVEQVLETGVKLQINLLSLSGYYSPGARKLCAWLIDKGYCHFLGTDAHKQEHLQQLKKVFASSLYAKIDFSRIENAR